MKGYMRQITAMKYLDIPKSTWYYLKSNGELPSPLIKKIGKTEIEFYKKEDLDSWMLGKFSLEKVIV